MEQNVLKIYLNLYTLRNFVLYLNYHHIKMHSLFNIINLFIYYKKN